MLFRSVSCLEQQDQAKFENKRGMDNFESILKMAGGIDRGYL